jgi:hypothetical protein
MHPGVATARLPISHLGGCLLIAVGTGIMAMTPELISINYPGRDLGQFSPWRIFSWGELGQPQFSEQDQEDANGQF